MQNKKVAILFFGLTRTQEKTSDSIKQNLLTPLNEHNLHYDVFYILIKFMGLIIICGLMNQPIIIIMKMLNKY